MFHEFSQLQTPNLEVKVVRNDDPKVKASKFQTENGPEDLS